MLTPLTTIVSEVSPDKYRLCSSSTIHTLEKHAGMPKEKSEAIEEFLVKNFFGPVRAQSLGGQLDKMGFW